MTVQATQQPLFTEESKLDAQFRAFHAEHPEVYDAFKHRAEYLRRRGKRRISAHSICYYLRDETPVDGRDGTEAYKINNSYSSRYARMLIEEDVSFRALIETRELKSA